MGKLSYVNGSSDGPLQAYSLWLDTVGLCFTGSNRILPRGDLTLPLNHLPHKQVLLKEGAK